MNIVGMHHMPTTASLSSGANGMLNGHSGQEMYSFWESIFAYRDSDASDLFGLFSAKQHITWGQLKIIDFFGEIIKLELCN